LPVEYETPAGIGTKYCVKTSGPGTAMRGAKVLVHQFADGRLRVAYQERVLAMTAYGTYPVPNAAVDEKTLDARVGAVDPAQKTAGSSRSRWRGGLKRLRRPAARLRGLTPPSPAAGGHRCRRRQPLSHAEPRDISTLGNQGTFLCWVDREGSATGGCDPPNLF
jgi:hypothetical protein